MPVRRLCSIGTALFAALRAAVPTRGRRSLACASLVLRRDCAVRCASRSGADQRSAFPCLCVACAPSGLRRSPRCAGRCRPEVGVPVPVRRLCSIGTALFAALRAAVPTRGRRSLACASLVLRRHCAVRCAAQGGADQRSALPCLCVACAPSGLRCSLRFAQRCRPEVGVPLTVRRLCSVGTALFAPLRAAVPTRGRRSLACASLVLRRDCAARPAARGGTDVRSAFPCLCVACAQSGLRRSPRCAGRCRPEVGVPLPVRRLCSVGTAPLAPLRGAVPTRGRRSPACASLVLRRDCAARPAARGGADRRSAFPCLCVACAQSGLRCSLRFAQRCRPEVGVPLPVRRLCSVGTALFAALRAAVPTRGRRSRACASLRLVAWAPEVGVPVLARRSAW